MTSTTAAGKKRETSTSPFDMPHYLENATHMLEKIKQTAENVTCCQNQIDQVFSRCNELLSALSADAGKLEPRKLREATGGIDEVLKNLHKHVLRFAIYGRPKAFVSREEMSSFFQGFNLEIDKVLKTFSVADHHDAQTWESEYYDAKLEDEKDEQEQLWGILNNESDLKVIMEMGQDAANSLRAAVKQALEFPPSQFPPARLNELGNVLKNLESHKPSDLMMMQPAALKKAPDPSRISSLRVRPAQASSSSTSLAPARKSSDIPGESAAARAKREEAEREREEAVRRGEAEYEEPAPPRWEPRRPPPGRGPGSMDGSMAAASALGNLSLDEPPPPSGPPPPMEGDDLPPSYS